MLVVNDTPFAFAPLSARVHWPDATLTLIVKGAFRLAHGARAEALEEQEPPLGDRFFDDDFAGECAYPSDFAPFKPRADLMLLGVARPRRATARATVALSVGDTSAKLEVIGDRYWADADTSTATKPLTFEVLPLRYTRAFGGDGHDHNPIGRGVFADKTRDPMLRPLPNIEWPDALVTDVASRPAPAGFGPLSSRWAARMQHAGTYDDGWLAERWPWFPADFDWSYFNAAPRPLQVEGYLRGDEAVALANLHVEHHAYHTQLPGLRLRCFLNETDGEQPDETTFREVDMNLDTLWIDAEAERLVLVWRGVARVRSEKLREIEHVYIASESLEDAPHPGPHYQQQLAARLLEGVEEEVATVEASNDNVPPPIDERAVLAKVHSVMGKVGAPDEMLALLSSGKPLDEVLETLMEQAGADPDKPEELQKKVREQTKKLLADAGEDPSILDVEEPVPPPPAWSRERVIISHQAGEAMSGVDLRGLDLSQLDLRGADFSGALLGGCNLSGARLYGTNFARASLPDADVTGAVFATANLSEADFTRAKADGADFSNAHLPAATLDAASLRGARFDDAEAPLASFRQADLSSAKLARANLRGAHLDGTSLDEAELVAAVLAEASLEGARGIDVDLSSADLSKLRASEGCRLVGAKLLGVRADGSMWVSADLSGADLSLSSLRRADFSEANLEGARLYGVDLADANFTECKLHGANASKANLWGACFDGADLSRADFRDANLYEAALWRAELKGARFEGAHVAATLLAEEKRG